MKPVAAFLVISCCLAAGVAAAAPATKAVASPKPTRASVAAQPAASSARSGGARTLDDIHIEGEIPVPQVLFITARDQRRFMEFQHRHYLRTSRQLGEATPLPSRIVLNRVAPTQAKETSR